MDILDGIPFSHIKTEEPYIEPSVQDAQTINDKIKQENEDFLRTAAEFNKIDMAATAQKSDFCNDFFDAIIDLPDSRQIIDDALTTEDIFIDEDLFNDKDIEDDNKQIVDDILKDINHSEILMQYEPTTITTKAIKRKPESLNFKYVLLPKRKNKKPSLLAANEAIHKTYKEIRQKKNNQLKFIKPRLIERCKL